MAQLSLTFFIDGSERVVVASHCFYGRPHSENVLSTEEPHKKTGFGFTVKALGKLGGIKAGGTHH